MNWRTGLLRAGWRLGQHGLVLVGMNETGADWANAKVAVRQPLFRDVAFEKPSDVLPTWFFRFCFVVWS